MELKRIFKGCVVLKNDSGYRPGIPDLLILHKNKWAVLECKKSATEKKQPNQQYYVDLLDSLSFAAFIYPENKDETLNALQQALRP